MSSPRRLSSGEEGPEPCKFLMRISTAVQGTDQRSASPSIKPKVTADLRAARRGVRARLEARTRRTRHLSEDESNRSDALVSHSLQNTYSENDDGTPFAPNQLAFSTDQVFDLAEHFLLEPGVARVDGRLLHAARDPVAGTDSLR